MQQYQVPADAQSIREREAVAERFRHLVFDSKEAARGALDKFLAYFGKSKASVHDSRRWMAYKCKGNGCPFRVNFSFEAADSSWHVSYLTGVDHNPCTGTLKPTSRTIAEGLKNVETSVLHGPIKGLQLYVTKELNISADLRQVSRARAKLLGLLDRWEESFAEIPSYVAEFRRLNPGGHAAFLTHPETRVFRGLAVVLPMAHLVATRFKRVWALDAAHLPSDWPEGRLLLLAAQDWDKTNVLFAAAIVDSECAENYGWFLEQIRQIPAVDAILHDRDSPLAIISDRGQVVSAALSTYVPRVVQRHCTKHLIGNVQAMLRAGGLPIPRQVEDLMWALQAAPTAEDYRVLFESLRRQFPEAARFLETSIEPSKWTVWASPVPMYGIRTSNMVEEENAPAFIPREASSPLEVIDELLLAMLSRLQSNSEAAKKAASLQPGTALCPAPAKFVERETAQSAHYQVYPVSGPIHTFVVRRVGCAEVRDDHEVKISNDFTSFECSCKIPEHHRLPCRHVYAATNHSNLGDPLIPVEYSVAEHARCYEAVGFFPPRRQVLTPSDEIRPPERAARKRQRGFPRSRQIPSHMDSPNAGEHPRTRSRLSVTRQCSLCHRPGHNRRSCPVQQAAAASSAS